MVFSDGSKQRLSVVIDLAKTVFHYGFIPTVLYLGFTKGSDPGMPEISVAKLVVNRIFFTALSGNQDVQQK